MIEDAKWAFGAVVWPPATKEAKGSALTFQQWCLLVGISFFMICLTLFAGSFLMSFFAPVTGKALWIGVAMCGVAAYYAYLMVIFGWKTKTI